MDIMFQLSWSHLQNQRSRMPKDTDCVAQPNMVMNEYIHLQILVLKKLRNGPDNLSTVKVTSLWAKVRDV